MALLFIYIYIKYCERIECQKANIEYSIKSQSDVTKLIEEKYGAANERLELDKQRLEIDKQILIEMKKQNELLKAKNDRERYNEKEDESYRERDEIDI